MHGWPARCAFASSGSPPLVLLLVFICSYVCSYGKINSLSLSLSLAEKDRKGIFGRIKDFVYDKAGWQIPTPAPEGKSSHC